MNKSGYYEDKICIVTGGNSGIGYALCEELLKRGAVVYMAGRNPKKVEKAAKQLSKYSARVNTIIVDVTVPEQVQEAIEDTAAEAGRLDFLFNNAGIGGTMPFETATLDDLKKIVDVNLWSVIYGVYTAVPIMLKQGYGHIVNTSSAAGIYPNSFQTLYALTKYGVTGFTESLRFEYAEKGIHFSTICPGNIATPIFKKSFDGTFHEQAEIPDDAIRADQAAVFILDRVAEHEGVIIIPEELRKLWQAYVIGVADDMFLQMAHERREAYEKKGTYF
ncbi:SDR family NAD(P)-dependent oxidoreductase [Methanobacterium petrolearium]|uniref:SDR family NAD(P)-dependent oxidoreductase n=1 Tax=Methanobacterium petrolearium TaxID=710190 RepID=UPI001AEA55FB|nr:SDR family oxidoreductase [Methanobacterium petrolearium]MBP1946124.1 NAD(P)-dependent dehydrogenase (short-subunit alcohol dehydrogenase family) [Methanobacterium petrolearium]BDZ70734.1 short-chain dehydrogenase [Methanobacterium petrolearium]